MYARSGSTQLLTRPSAPTTGVPSASNRQTLAVSQAVVRSSGGAFHAGAPCADIVLVDRSSPEVHRLPQRLLPQARAQGSGRLPAVSVISDLSVTTAVVSCGRPSTFSRDLLVSRAPQPIEADLAGREPILQGIRSGREGLLDGVL